MCISFDKAALQYKDRIFSWLDKPYVQAFWDNSDLYRVDLDVFMNGRKIPSPYFDGIFDYWVGTKNEEPFCLMMSNQVLPNDDVPDLWKTHLSRTGNTVSLDFMIGEEAFLGKGYAPVAINAFITFYLSNIDAKTDLFLIDPDKDNKKALRAYENAGFVKAGAFLAMTQAYKGQETILMIKNVSERENCNLSKSSGDEHLSPFAQGFDAPRAIRLRAYRDARAPALVDEAPL